MGQRSQIYVIDSRTVILNSNGEDKPINPNGPVLVDAIYDQWNYSEGMVSRARAIIEEINNSSHWHDRENGETRTQRIAAVNFDMRDVHRQTDLILEEADTQRFDGVYDKSFLLGHENNDGILFINVTDEGVKYAITDTDASKSIGAEEYLNNYINPDGRYTSWRDVHVDKEYYASQPWMQDKTIEKIKSLCNAHVEAGMEIIRYTDANLGYIKRNAAIMTEAELDRLIDHDYTPTVDVEAHKGFNVSHAEKRITELEDQVRDLQEKLQSAEQEIDENAAKAVGFYCGELVYLSELEQAALCESVDVTKMNIFTHAGREDDDNRFGRYHMTKEGEFLDDKGNAIRDKKNQIYVVDKPSYERVIAKANFEMEAFPMASEAVACAIKDMVAAGFKPNEIQMKLQSYIDEKCGAKGIIRINMIPAGLVKPKDAEIEANRNVTYSMLLKDCDEISNVIWGIRNMAKEAIKERMGRQKPVDRSRENNGQQMKHIEKQGKKEVGMVI